MAISSSLLFALLISSLMLETSFTFEGQYTISSLSPPAASVCTPSIGSIKRKSTLEVFHRHNPCSQLSQNHAPSPSEILSNDESRVKYIQARLNEHDESLDQKVDLPIQQFNPSSDYIVSISMGSPRKTLSLIIDTGSDLTWTQCQPCTTSCYKQLNPIFDPSSSTSYSNVTCASSECSQLTSATGFNPGCSNGTCLYGILYVDRSFSNGIFGRDTLSITASDVFPNFLFGCGQNNLGLFGLADGLIGLDRGPLSLVSQTSEKYRKYFSYCLPSTASLTGFLTLGNDTCSTDVKFTPFDRPSSSFYFITITSISVGGIPLPVNRTAFQTRAGTIIDSGTVITRLPQPAYTALSTMFKQQMAKYPSAPPFSLFDTCFSFPNSTSIVVPTISFTFDGDVKVDLAPSGTLFLVDDKTACLAFAGSGGVGIFGNTQQKTLEVVYDVAGGRLGFGPGGCN